MILSLPATERVMTWKSCGRVRGIEASEALLPDDILLLAWNITYFTCVDRKAKLFQESTSNLNLKSPSNRCYKRSSIKCPFVTCPSWFPSLQI